MLRNVTAATAQKKVFELVFGLKVCEDQKKGLYRKIKGSVGFRSKRSEKGKVFTTNRWRYGFTS